MFRILVRHFVYRLFDSGGDSEDEIGVSGVLAILAIPGAFFALIILDKYSSFLRWMRSIHDFDPNTASLPDKCFFLVLSMAVTGVVTVLKWDEILPDRRDFANLAHLPVPLFTMFGAKLTAVFAAAAIFAIDVNAGSSILFPVVVTADKGTAGELLRFSIVHGSIMVVASLTIFFGLLTFIGLLGTTKLALAVRVAAVGGILLMLCAMPPLLPLLNRGSWPQWYAMFPPLWFLGWYQELQGKATLPMLAAAHLAKLALGGSFVLAMAASAINYRRFFLKIPERVAIHRRWWMIKLPSWPRWLLRTPFERACFPFAVQTLIRSDRHCLVLGAFLVVGSILTIQNSASPLIFIYFTITGLRFVIDIPSDIRANWIFRMIVDEERHECRTLARKLILVVALPAMAIVFPWTARTGLLALYYLLCALALTEILLLRYRKIPFTCAFPAARNHAVLWILLYLLGLAVFQGWCTFWASWMSRNPIRFLWMLPFCAIFLALTTHYRHRIIALDRVLLFEEKPPAAVAVLNLSGQTP